MKSVVIVCLMCLVAVHGLPANKKDEVEVIPARGNQGDQPVVDTGIFTTSDAGFGLNFDLLQGLMTRIRQQMDQLIRNFPFPGSSNETDIAGFPDFSIGGAQFPPIDLGKGNTTSVTKIIDGHKVVINETEYQKQDDFGGSFFKVRIIDVQPDSNETSDEVPATAVTKDREPLENNNSFENEIPKGTEVGKSSTPEKVIQA